MTHAKTPCHVFTVQRSLVLVENWCCAFLQVDGATALHIASYKGHLEVVELLLANWANPNIRDKVKTDSSAHTELSNGVWYCSYSGKFCNA